MHRSLLPLLLLVACTPTVDRHSEPRLPRDTPASQPAVSSFSDRAGMEVLRKWTLECYDLGLKHNEVFARGGSLLIRWHADKAGDLLHLDFAVDSFQGWEINDTGETLASCVTSRAREAGSKVRWSLEGAAPLRLAPSPASRP